MKRLTFANLFLTAFLTVSGQTDNSNVFKQKTNDLSVIFSEIQKSTDFTTRTNLNKKIEAFFDSILYIKESFFYPFDTLRNFITCLYSDDKVWRLINWNIPHDDKTHSYFAYIQHYSKKEDSLTTTKLTDQNKSLKNPESLTLKPDQWLGALYYEIIPTRIKKQEIFYVLLGWDGYSLLAKRKIIDVVSFNNGIPVFGKEVFEMPKGLQKRIIFTYNFRVDMKLRWDFFNGLIIFDNLEPIPDISPKIEGNLAPSMLYDGLEWNGTTWKYKHNISVKEPDEKKKKRPKPYPY